MRGEDNPPWMKKEVSSRPEPEKMLEFPSDGQSDVMSMEGSCLMVRKYKKFFNKYGRPFNMELFNTD